MSSIVPSPGSLEVRAISASSPLPGTPLVTDGDARSASSAASTPSPQQLSAELRPSPPAPPATFLAAPLESLQAPLLQSHHLPYVRAGLSTLSTHTIPAVRVQAAQQWLQSRPISGNLVQDSCLCHCSTSLVCSLYEPRIRAS